MTGFARASFVESLAFTGLHVLPNLVRGTFLRTRTGSWLRSRLPDASGARLFERLRRRHGGRPVLVRMGFRHVLLPTLLADFDNVLNYSPAVYAEPGAKRRGMSHFQPGALTISRGADWRQKRMCNEHVLGFNGLPSDLQRHVVAIVREETERSCGGREFVHGQVALAFDRIAQRLVLGGTAAEPMAWLRRLMRRANWMVGLGGGRTRRRFLDWLRTWSPSDGHCLAARLLAGTGPVESEAALAHSPRSQLPHLMFAIGDTLSEGCVLALCAILAHPEALDRVQQEGRENGPSPAPFTVACFLEAMRLWTPTPMLLREAICPDLLNYSSIAIGQQVVLWHGAMHRDGAAFDEPDRFHPDRYLGVAATPNRALSGGGQACAGGELCLLIARTFLATALRAGSMRLAAPRLSRPRMPATCNHFELRVVRVNA